MRLRRLATRAAGVGSAVGGGGAACFVCCFATTLLLSIRPRSLRGAPAHVCADHSRSRLHAPPASRPPGRRLSGPGCARTAFPSPRSPLSGPRPRAKAPSPSKRHLRTNLESSATRAPVRSFLPLQFVLEELPASSEGAARLALDDVGRAVDVEPGNDESAALDALVLPDLLLDLVHLGVIELLERDVLFLQARESLD